MTTPELQLAPHAAQAYQDALLRAEAQYFLFWQTSSRGEAEQAIRDVFYQAAAINEAIDGRSPAAERFLDASETRLAVAALNLAAGGQRNLGRSTAAKAEQWLWECRALIQGISHKNPGEAEPESLIQLTQSRAKGWRRIPDSMVAREIRAVFKNEAVRRFDGDPGLSMIDSLFAYLYLNDQSGGTNADIEFRDVLWTTPRIEYAGNALPQMIANSRGGV